MAPPFVLPLDKIWTSFLALFPRCYFLPVNFGFFLLTFSKSSKLDDAFCKAADLLYLEC